MKKILLIEDRADILNLFLKSLRTEGFYAVGAENGLIGVQRAEQECPHLIVSDITMPKLDGYGVLTTLRQNPATAIIPLIFLTGKASRADIRKGMELGADDYLTKPCTVNELVKAITACLEKRATLYQSYTTQPQLASQVASAKTTSSASSQSIFPSDSHLSEVFNFIEANYHQPITLSDVAVAVGYSPAYLTKLVRRQTGKTVQRWIIQRRMAAACYLLLETPEKVEEIAARVGYQCAVHFFRQFRQYQGTTPQAWRKEHHS